MGEMKERMLRGELYIADLGSGTLYRVVAGG